MAKKWMIALAAIFMAAVIFAACGKGSDKQEKTTAAPGAVGDDGETDAVDQSVGKDADIVKSDGTNPVATIEMEDGGVIKVELYPDIAPNTVKNFISLANSGFYDGTIFHRVIQNFMIQGGDPNGNGTGGPGYMIPGEFSANGFENGLNHTRGVISMGRLPTGADTAGCQFFICVADCDWLDGQYASFGKVLEGMDVVDAIVSVETDVSDKPLNDQVMKTVRVDTLGVDYGEPETIPEN